MPESRDRPEIGAETVVPTEQQPEVSRVGPGPVPPEFSDIWHDRIDPEETVLWHGHAVHDGKAARPLRLLVPLAMIPIGLWLVVQGDPVLAVGGAVFAFLAFRAWRRANRGEDEEPTRFYLLTDRAAYIATRGLLGTRLYRYPLRQWRNLHRRGRNVIFATERQHNQDGDTRETPVGFTDLPDAATVLDLFRQLQTR